MLCGCILQSFTRQFCTLYTVDNEDYFINKVLQIICMFRHVLEENIENKIQICKFHKFEVSYFHLIL